MKKTYSDEKVNEWKAKYPHVVKELEIYPSGVEFDKDGQASEDPVYYLIRKPSKALLNLLSSKEYKGEQNTEKANDAMIKNCVLEGDMERMENDGSICTSLLEKIANLVNATKVTLKKV
jgi:hypothetical protein